MQRVFTKPRISHTWLTAFYLLHGGYHFTTKQAPMSLADQGGGSRDQPRVHNRKRRTRATAQIPMNSAVEEMVSNSFMSYKLCDWHSANAQSALCTRRRRQR
jgi:hypothetical protein